MYQVPQAFIDECKSDVRGYKQGRIEVYNADGSYDTTITSEDYLVSFKITSNPYNNNTIIGSAVSRQIEIKLRDDSTIDLANKRVSLSIQWDYDYDEHGQPQQTFSLPFGTYIIESNKDSTIKKVTEFKGYDLLYQLNDKFDPNGFPFSEETTMFDLFTYIAHQNGLPVLNESIVNGDLVISANPFVNGETYIEVLRAIAEVAGGFAKVTRDDKLAISNLALYDEEEPNNVDEIVPANYMADFEKGQYYTPIERIAISIDAEISGEDTFRPIDAPDTAKTYGIHGNKLLGMQADREAVATPIWNVLGGFEYQPFKVTHYGLPYLDSGDLILVNDGENDYVSYVFNFTIEYAGSFKEVFDTPAITDVQSKYVQTASLKETLKTFEFNVNRAEQTVNIMASQVLDDEGNLQVVKTSDFETTMAGFSDTISETTSKVDDVTGEITTLNTKTSNLENTIDRLTKRIEDSGGNNIFYYSKKFWVNGASDDPNAQPPMSMVNEYANSVSKKGYIFSSGNSKQIAKVSNENQYTISFKYKTLVPSDENKVRINGTEYGLNDAVDDQDNPIWKEFLPVAYVDEEGQTKYRALTLTSGSDEVIIEFLTDTANAIEICDLMGNIGDTAEYWTQNPNETRTALVTIDTGITVKNSENVNNTALRADSDGVRIIKDYDDNQVVQPSQVIAEFTDTGEKVTQINVTGTSTLGHLVVQDVGNQIWLSNTFNT